MIILVGQSTKQVQPPIDEIRESNPQIQVKFIAADLASLKSARNAAQTIPEEQEITKIDVLINNAGVMACPFQTTEDRLEFQLAISDISS
ncbi:uncharacterized protein BCR38DRAFT_435408 [Pseudomassariella vexata]|uniref:Ketoreductase (KR) domain-containing protein n=1 Tax=Pseudomassariella vexata TaxID=1141098 RepID=A0A1Y2DUM7_9PEZI|nr:uncharacterized protein BCR38DRAFT_435408 [Pseudomassariella vexata]ORY62899.1 hypothetical protein BCR38DRAFT_435408 [Pseudomassariella vexata]